MASAEFFLTLHPEPRKDGVRIEKEKYDVIRSAILDLLRTKGAMTFSQLGSVLESRLTKSFDGSVMWYFTTVKLDLEARREIRRVPDSSPQTVEII